MGGRKKAANKSATPLSGARGRTQPRGSPAGTRQSANNPPTPPQDADGFILALSGARHTSGPTAASPHRRHRARPRPRHSRTVTVQVHRPRTHSRSVELKTARVSKLPPTPDLLNTADALNRNKTEHVLETMARLVFSDTKSHRSSETTMSSLNRMEQRLQQNIKQLTKFARFLQAQDPDSADYKEALANLSGSSEDLKVLRARIAAREAPDERGVPQTVAVKAAGDADDMSAIKSPDDAQREAPLGILGRPSSVLLLNSVTENKPLLLHFIIYILLLMELMALKSVLQFSDQLEFPIPGDFLFKKIPWFRRNKTPGYFCA
ncbi:hypothetical protein THAOC_32064 [Thalassiosira oceanica]|uniref:Uncharacterized protein n=1 Tax=Thalassiosira oceanica TaxID=159749 RepID=K0R6T7_THAOC|nr:hypothetical protein THAOC_32064 [Thalassiosira oceanica]|eukprot:EJK49093.1 hypothetical protein THAOC_32064 [Thalassiosira oceanica]